MGDEVQVSLEPILEVDNVTVRRNKTDVIKEVNLVIHRGEFVGMVGPNGGGKSTLMQSVLGILSLLKTKVRLEEEAGTSPAGTRLVPAWYQLSWYQGQPSLADDRPSPAQPGR